MTRSLMDRFAASGFKPIEVDGSVVHPMYRTQVREGDTVRVTWLDAQSPRPQGLTLRLRVPGRTGRRGEGGLLRVESVDAPTIVLWTESAPPVVEAECVTLQPGAELQVSNRWRLPDGREDEWLNNYGMKIEAAEGDAVVLHCSDGYGAPAFDDLTVRVDVLRPVTR